MVNAWSLLYDEIYGIDKMTDDKNRITPQESDEYDPPEEKQPKTYDEMIAAGYEMTGDGFWVGSGNTATEPEHSPYYYDYTRNDPDAKNPFTDAFDYAMDKVSVSGGSTDSYPYFDTLNIDTSGYPSEFTTFSDNDDAVAHLIDNPVSSGIEDNSIRKYNEDESIKALQEYISTTYGGHYTSEQNNVQTLDLIESVGDAEAFCRSNAIKYLSRYDKKGQAKRDILKALHYSLLLYHFSGQLNETPTRGYETF